MRPVSMLPMPVPHRLLGWAVLCAALVPGVALAHGEEALVIGLLLPVSMVPGVFLVSVWFWRTDVATKLLTGLLLVVIGAALVRVDLVLLDAVVGLTRSAPRFLEVLMWFAPPIIVQGAAWALIARWRRRQVARQ